MCVMPKHYARQCSHHKGQAKESDAITTEEEIIVMVSEVLAFSSNVPRWLYDTCATIYFSYDKTLFKTRVEVTDGQEIQMGSKGRSKMVDKGNVEIATLRKRRSL